MRFPACYLGIGLCGLGVIVIMYCSIFYSFIFFALSLFWQGFGALLFTGVSDFWILNEEWRIIKVQIEGKLPWNVILSFVVRVIGIKLKIKRWFWNRVLFKRDERYFGMSVSIVHKRGMFNFGRKVKKLTELKFISQLYWILYGDAIEWREIIIIIYVD